MKRIIMNRTVVAALPPPPEPEAEEPEAETEAELVPPPPAQMNAPVGAPPAPVAAPEGIEETLAMALKARNGRIEFALFWAQMAQALATKQVADHLDELLNFLGARDAEELPDGDESDPRLQDQITMGLLSAINELRELMPGIVKAAAP